jgi:hypothetical protein
MKINVQGNQALFPGEQIYLWTKSVVLERYQIFFRFYCGEKLMWTKVALVYQGLATIW